MMKQTDGRSMSKTHLEYIIDHNKPKRKTNRDEDTKKRRKKSTTAHKIKTATKQKGGQ